MNEQKNPLSFQLDVSDFLPADESEKQSQVVMRESVNFWKDGFRRLRKNPVAMVSLVVVICILIFAFIMPAFYPYSYEEQIRGAENLKFMEYSEKEQAMIDAGEKVFPHILGTDNLGRDTMVRTMMGSRISLLVGIVASVIILIIGSTYGAVAGYFGGHIDLIMMRLVDIIYTVPDILIIILLQMTLKEPLKALALKPGFGWINKIGVGLVCIFIVFALLYWVGMSRIVRSQVLTLKEQEYVTAAKALGGNSSRIIKKHLLTNCIGTLIVTTTLQIPSSIFTESYLSFIGLGVAAPMPSLGSMASDAIGGIRSYPERLFVPAIMISLIILAFNLLGDGLRDAFDPKLKKVERRFTKMSEQNVLLDVENLKISFFTPAGEVQSVRDVTFQLKEGEVLGIVGESGSGKSVTAFSIMKLTPYPGRVVGGHIDFNGHRITDLTERDMRKIRGKEVSMIFQDPMTSLNPVYTIGNQICEVILLHTEANKKQAWKKAIELLGLVGINEPEKRMKQYPHELSGGMRQRVMIAIALACEPKLLIADEPTTALDVTIQAQILELMMELKEKLGMSIIIITHDLGVVANMCDKIAVMYGGKIVEYGTSDDIFYNPKHEYTKGLLNSIPRLDAMEHEKLVPIEGVPVDAMNPPAGCPFAPRCPQCMKICLKQMPEYTPLEEEHYSACWLLQKEALEGGF